MEALKYKILETCSILFDEDRKSFTNANDQRLACLKPLATIFKNLDTYSVSNKTRISRLTTGMEWNGILKLIVCLLTKIKSVLTMEFQSDRIEGDLGIYR